MANILVLGMENVMSNLLIFCNMFNSNGAVNDSDFIALNGRIIITE